MIFYQQQPRPKPLCPSEVACAYLQVTIRLTVITMTGCCSVREDLELEVLPFSIRANYSWQISLNFSEIVCSP